MENQTNWTHTEIHSWPHIPAIQWEQVSWYISNTVITTLIFFFIVLIISIFANKALKSEKKSRIKLFFINFVGFFDKYLIDSFWNKNFARKYYPLLVWIFIIILFWNLFWLIIDWLWISVSADILRYLRPMNSDLNTTLALALIAITMFIWIWIKTNWFSWTLRWYLCNFTWENIWMKFINVFVWWLHLLSVPSSMLSLSLRLFWNIFAWIVLVWVITYLWWMMSAKLFEVGKVLSLPFWFFEIFVAFIQAIVFTWLVISYFNQASEEHH